MYNLTKNEIDLYVTTIHNAYPEAPEEAMDAMRERFTEMELTDDFLERAHEKMTILDTALLLNNLSRHHLTTEMALDVVSHFYDKNITSQLHSQWPDERMEERIQIVAKWHITDTYVPQYKEMQTQEQPQQKKKIFGIPAIVKYFLNPSMT